MIPDEQRLLDFLNHQTSVAALKVYLEHIEGHDLYVEEVGQDLYLLLPQADPSSHYNIVFWNQIYHHNLEQVYRIMSGNCLEVPCLGQQWRYQNEILL